MKKIVVALSLLLSACAVNVGAKDSRWVGQPVSGLVGRLGMPERTMTSPAGATVYVYGFHNLQGTETCQAIYFVRNDNVVGFSKKGVAINCDESVGDTK